MTLTEMQAVIENAVKDKLCVRYNIPRDSFRIELAPRLKWSYTIQPGTCVIIKMGVMPWMNKEVFHECVKRAVKQVPLYRSPLSVERYAMVEQRRKDARGAANMMVKKKYGEEADLFHDLLPAARIKFTVETVVTATDIVTGLTTEVRSVTAISNELKANAHNILSHMVTEQEFNNE